MPEIHEKSPFYAQGLHFSCTRCSACCRHESGYVYLSGKDTLRLEEYIKISGKELTETFCRWIPAENGNEWLSLREKPNYDCIFWASDTLEGGGCTVYEARPLQCRAFPFWSAVVSSPKNWRITAASCPGANSGTLHSPASIEKWLALRQKEPIIERACSTGIKKLKGES